MCGRTCLTLEPHEILDCCKYKSNKVKNQKPEWRPEYNFGKAYAPSYNVAPTDISPVLVSASHFDDSVESQYEQVVVPMMWGMIPRWHKGDYKKHGLSTNNCRFENLAVSKLYSKPFLEGNRCVILCEGFYEWQTTKNAKASERSAFFVHIPQSDGIKIEDKSTWNTHDNVKLMKVAGLFDVWENEQGDKIYSYTVITLGSTENFSEIHHRLPAILDTNDQVADWLNYNKVPAVKALNILQPSETITWHPVSNIVNNSRNKSDQCNKKIVEGQTKVQQNRTPKSKIMQNWLISGKRKHEEDQDDKKNIKMPKNE